MPPTTDFNGRKTITKYVNLLEADKKMYEAEKKVHVVIIMALSQEILHTFKK